MKAFFFTVLIFAAIFVGYDYFIGHEFIFKTPPTEVQAGSSASKPDAHKDDTAYRDLPPIPQDAPAPPATKSDEAPSLPPPPKPAVEVTADASGFVMPKYESLETLTKGWTHIPATAFPRPVHINKAVPFKMSVGSSNMNAGAEVTALAFEQGMLTLAPAATSTARASVALDDTDLKAVLTAGYEHWKVRRTSALKLAHERRLAGAKNSPPSTPSTDSALMPERASDGSYPVLVNHLKSGEVTEIQLKHIHHWGEAQATQYQGKPAWSIKIQFEANTVFGLQPVEAQAIVSSGRVQGWFYTGTGEPVP